MLDELSIKRLWANSIADFNLPDPAGPSKRKALGILPELIIDFSSLSASIIELKIILKCYKCHIFENI